MTIKEARKFMAKELKDPGLRQAYLANIAMCIYDDSSNSKLTINDCNEIAEKLINLIFEDKR